MHSLYNPVETIVITYIRSLCLVFQILGFCDCLNVKISILFWIPILCNSVGCINQILCYGLVWLNED